MKKIDFKNFIDGIKNTSNPFAWKIPKMNLWSVWNNKWWFDFRYYLNEIISKLGWLLSSMDVYIKKYASVWLMFLYLWGIYFIVNILFILYSTIDSIKILNDRETQLIQLEKIVSDNLDLLKKSNQTKIDIQNITVQDFLFHLLIVVKLVNKNIEYADIKIDQFPNNIEVSFEYVKYTDIDSIFKQLRLFKNIFMEKEASMELIDDKDLWTSYYTITLKGDLKKLELPTILKK